jgi:hypothetical protein
MLAVMLWSGMGFGARRGLEFAISVAGASWLSQACSFPNFELRGSTNEAVAGSPYRRNLLETKRDRVDPQDHSRIVRVISPTYAADLRSVV